MIFVVGSSRSGTTLLARLLNQHPDLFMFHELHFFEEIYDPLQGNAAISDDVANKMAAQLLARQATGFFFEDVTAYKRAAQAFVADLPRPIYPLALFDKFLHEAATGRTPIEQTPRNVFFAEQILTAYPTARIVHIVRDGRDVLLSQKRKWRHFWHDPAVPRFQCVRFWASYHPVTQSLLWNSGLAAAAKVENHPRMLTVRFEDLLLQTRETMRAITDFLAIDLQPQMLSVAQSGSSHEAGEGLAEGLNVSTVQRWKQTSFGRIDLALMQRASHSQLLQHGYTLDPTLRLDWLQMIWIWLTFPIKSVLALAFNLNRTRNLVQSIRLRLLGR